MRIRAPSSVWSCTRTSGRQKPSGDIAIQSPPGMAISARTPSPVSVPLVISQYWRGPRGEPSVGPSGPRIEKR
jgi:hypothetical protein